MKTEDQIRARIAELRTRLAVAYEQMRPSQPLQVRESAPATARRLEGEIRGLEWVIAQ